MKQGERNAFATEPRQQYAVISLLSRTQRIQQGADWLALAAYLRTLMARLEGGEPTV